MLCPSCGQNVGESMQLCDACAEVKRQEDERKQAEQEALEAEAGPAVESSKEPLSDLQMLSGLDKDTRFMIVKALAVALVVLVVLLLLLLIIT